MTEPQNESDVLNSKTAAGLLMFYDVKERRHELAEGVVSPLRTATKRMLEVTDAEAEDVDLATLDLDELFVRFRNKNSASLTDKSHAAYVSRFRRGMTMYLRWLDRDPNWRGKLRASPSGNGSAKTSKGKASVEPADSVQLDDESSPAEQHAVAPNRRHTVAQPEQPLIDYKVPLLDSGATAILWLPRIFTTDDATRMTALISALAVPNLPRTSDDA